MQTYVKLRSHYLWLSLHVAGGEVFSRRFQVTSVNYIFGRKRLNINGILEIINTVVHKMFDL